MLTKQQKYLNRQYMLGKLNLAKAARRLGYRGGSMDKGMRHIRDILKEMNIQVL